MNKKNVGKFSLPVGAMLSFVILPVLAIMLATNQYTRNWLVHFYHEPELVTLRLYDTEANTEQKHFLAEHLPGIFQPSFACQKVDGAQKSVVFAGDLIESTATPVFVYCASGLIIQLNKNSKIRFVREFNLERGVSIESGSAFINFNNRRPFYVTDQWGSLKISAEKYVELLLVKKNKIATVILLAGSSKIVPQINFAPENLQSHLLYAKSEGGHADFYSADEERKPLTLLPAKSYAVDSSGVWDLLDYEEAKKLASFKDIGESFGFSSEPVVMGGQHVVRYTTQGAKAEFSIEFTWGLNLGPEHEGLCAFSLFQDQALNKKIFTGMGDQFIKVDKLPPGTFFCTVDCRFEKRSFHSNIQPFSLSSEVQMLQPVSGAAVSGGVLDLVWAPFYQAPQYELQFSAVQNFSTFSKMNVLGTSVRIKLPPGNYFWRVIAQAADKTYLSAPPVNPFQLKIE